MSIFHYLDTDALGQVQSVDTASVVVNVADVAKLRTMQVNRLVALQSSKAGQHLIGMIQKITRAATGTSALEESENELEDALEERNLVRITLIGTLIDREGLRENVFRRTLETVPEIDANCFPLERHELTAFMRVVAEVGGDGQRLMLGNYTLDKEAKAYLNGNRLFQRHAIIVGSTGSGKSWTTAKILVEQV